MATTHRIFIKKDKNGIRMTIERIPLHKLKLDPDNVRFRNIKGKLHDDEIEDLIWNENDTKKLYQSILASGGLSEKPFVSLKNVVYEGNRRIVCLRKIVKNIKEGILKDTDRSRYDAVECEMPIDDIAPLELDILKARWHVSGKKEWDALNQAGHVYDLYHNRGLSYEEIQAFVQMSKNQVYISHKAYQLTVEYMEAYPDDADIKRFNYFSEAYTHKSIRDWIEEDERNKELLFEWIHDKKFDDSGSSDIRNFRFVLPNKLAMKEFTSKTGAYTSAMKIALKDDVSLGSKTFRIIKHATKTIENMPRGEFKSIPKDTTKKNILFELYNKLEKMFKELGIKP